MKIFLYILILITISGFLKAQDKPKSLKDSLLLLYTMEELRKMSFVERRNTIRKIRGLEPIIVSEPTHDYYGIEIVKDIPVEEASSIVDKRVKLISQELPTYRQEIFPNTYIEAIDAEYGRFYESVISRKLDRKNYKNYFDEFTEGDTTAFSNISKRTYFFNQDSQLMLITIELGYNINAGGKFSWSADLPYYYNREEYYIWNDSLQFHMVISGEQPVSIGPYYSPKQLDTVLVNAHERRQYFHKHNGFNLYTREGSFERPEWETKLKELIYEYERDAPGSNYVIMMQNHILEYEEYKQGLNDYLKPVKTSFLQPYIKEP